MVSRVRALSLSLVLCLGGFIGLDHTAFAAVIVGQAPCTGESGFCLQFAAGDPIPTIRAITFNAPSAGKAAVTFHGSLLCSNETTADKVVDLVTQIVTNATAVPAADGPGGMRLAVVLKDLPEHLFDTTDAFNLASTRVVNIPAAGKRKFFFKMTALRMDTGTICTVYNAAFTVQFAP